MSSRAAHSRARLWATALTSDPCATDRRLGTRRPTSQTLATYSIVCLRDGSTGSRASVRPWRERVSSAATLTCERITVVPDPRRRPNHNPGGSAMNVTDKVCVVTGGASGIGLALCTRFAQDRAHVVLSDLGGRFDASWPCRSRVMLEIRAEGKRWAWPPLGSSRHQRRVPPRAIVSVAREPSQARPGGRSFDTRMRKAGLPTRSGATSWCADLRLLKRQRSSIRGPTAQRAPRRAAPRSGGPRLCVRWLRAAPAVLD